MTARKPVALQVVQDHLTEAEASFVEAAKQTAPMVQRLATHRDRLDLALKELDSERSALVSRRDLFRRQAAAVEEGLTLHIDDIEATMNMYVAGLASLPVGD